MTKHTSLDTIRDEHSALAAILRSLRMMGERGPRDEPQGFFDVMRAMLFYIDEFPERLHHPKESDLLFPHMARSVPELLPLIARLEREHMHGEAAVRRLQHLLLAWELLGESRREAFMQELDRYLSFYLEHMRVEEQEILPRAEQALSADEWAALDAAFAQNRDPMTGKYPRDAAYDRLFTRIVMKAPAPIGLGGT
ncbi:MAG: hemerythrin domain-containing protein [Ramlibacter sp.]|jgi:hemerythrin-like domain-containing protein|nr:hemerythrin domain-containing protein [Ramlibacter sp.]